ncbi:unnamed protein product [Rotaria socialis]|uniref:Uncharacterized protein n=2 Tax=Rotaria socialis TaxID=392032 RepID=A0A820VKD9_9BILA|nr:unnamed protein product [Rotaria socialis]CAF3359230.1 unnamed protein product [Rotaria socialis]CAF3391962.1 unnamed protein product [Rotaria socialis]CAF3471263.1 unnamed protein product [Rotaria socialis]CAF3541799.1 unnamed protein product [Rotaria socialis]
MASIEYLSDKNNSDSLRSTTPSLSIIVDSSECSTTKCKRIGCENSSIEHPEWDGEYCSAQCLSVFCKEAFEQWVKKHQPMS